MEVIEIVKIGFDIVDESIDFNKSKEENNKLYRERYKKVHGEYPPTLEELREKYKDSPEKLKLLNDSLKKIDKLQHP
ncbi:MAG: hypothetical protein MI740_10445 [Halanaerobiales bacterium]|nr:hypothetical protein [Halanaerobiales bacterium]